MFPRNKPPDTPGVDEVGEAPVFRPAVLLVGVVGVEQGEVVAVDVGELRLGFVRCLLRFFRPHEHLGDGAEKKAKKKRKKKRNALRVLSWS